MAGLLLVVGLVVAGAAGGEAVLCYRCHQDDCEGFLPSRAATVDCAESCLVTRSAFQGVMVEGRGCGAGRGRDSCHTRQLGGGARATVCSCGPLQHCGEGASSTRCRPRLAVAQTHSLNLTI